MSCQLKNVGASEDSHVRTRTHARSLARAGNYFYRFVFTLYKNQLRNMKMRRSTIDYWLKNDPTLWQRYVNNHYGNDHKTGQESVSYEIMSSSSSSSLITASASPWLVLDSLDKYQTRRSNFMRHRFISLWWEPHKKRRHHHHHHHQHHHHLLLLLRYSSLLKNTTGSN